MNKISSCLFCFVIFSQFIVSWAQEATDSTNNIEWVILALCGGLILIAAIIILIVFCCCGLCGRGGGMCQGAGGGQGMCMPGGGQPIYIQQVAPANPYQAPPNLTVNETANPVPDPTFLSNVNSGGNVKLQPQPNGKVQLAGPNKVQMIRMEKDNPVNAVREVVRQYYNIPDPNRPAPPPVPAATQTGPVRPSYVLQDSNYARGRSEAPYQIIRNQDGQFDNSKWVPPWERK